jgi:hypothetical protein
MIHAAGVQKFASARQRRQQRLKLLRTQQLQRMWVEGNDDDRAASGIGRQRSEQLDMTAMHAIEIADRHRAPSDFRWDGVAIRSSNRRHALRPFFHAPTPRRYHRN